MEQEKLLMKSLKYKVATLGQLVRLLDLTRYQDFVDLEDNDCYVNWYGIKIGLLEPYEDECYTVNKNGKTSSGS